MNVPHIIFVTKFMYWDYSNAVWVTGKNVQYARPPGMYTKIATEEGLLPETVTYRLHTYKGKDSSNDLCFSKDALGKFIESGVILPVVVTSVPQYFSVLNLFEILQC